MSFFSRQAAAGVLVGLLSIAPAYAQQGSPTGSTAIPNTDTGTMTRYDHRRGLDWGWLGLLGLLGLFGLRKPTNLYQDRDRVYQDRTTTR